ncbi:24876_t:CDS:2, partial [Dentiscutata erythropus]
MSTNPNPQNISCLKTLTLNILKNSSLDIIAKGIEVPELDPCSSCLEDYIKDLPQCPKCAMEIESIDYVHSGTSEQKGIKKEPTNLKKLIDELTTENLDSTENIITQSSSVPTGENNPESVDFLNLYRQIVKAEDGNKKAIQNVIRTYYNFGHDLKKRLKYYKKNHKKQAVGVYPIESEDCELDITLFIPMNDEERDPNSQSIFETNEYYCVGGKIVLGSYNGNLRLKMTVASSTHLSIKKDFGSNRCPLKVSLVGVAQDAPKEINRENAILNVLVNDYARQIYMLFVVGQMEIIEKDLYVYAVDISYVDTGSATKKK